LRRKRSVSSEREIPDDSGAMFIEMIAHSPTCRAFQDRLAGVTSTPAKALAARAQARSQSSCRSEDHPKVSGANEVFPQSVKFQMIRARCSLR
ncbi:MAG: hypothetical protein LAP21_27060, partial [Acidobacteriia bacterium]|nr:hypothetical protein [Terriglobia bacterium]